MGNVSNLDGASMNYVSPDGVPIVSLRVEKAAKAVDRSRRFLDIAIAQGDLIAHKSGKNTMVNVDDLIAWTKSWPVVERASA